MPFYIPQVPIRPPYVATHRYALTRAVFVNAVVPAVDQIYFHPFTLERPLPFSAFGIRVTTAGTASMR